MALREFCSRMGASLSQDARSLSLRPAWPAQQQCRRLATTAADPDIETEASLNSTGPDEELVKNYDPIARARSRRRQLPSSRYKFRSPRYYRGPLHPHQPPPPTDPSSREFVPGPFSLPRLEQTWESTIAPDLLTLNYQHAPPGMEIVAKARGLRPWVGDNPYFKNRVPRPPRGGMFLPARKPITFRNVPRLREITVHSMVGQAMEDSGYLHVAGMAVQAITNKRAQVHEAKESVQNWGVKKGRPVSVTVDLQGEDMYHFLAKVVEVVFPRIRDFKGIKGTSGDSYGNITFGLTPEEVAMFPEIEVNYDMYPAKMIPGAHVTIKTSAVTDRDARMLLRSMGVPFYGKLVD
ncbi:ribosomal protein L5 domain-containing protein [Lineolata rhizophorae]|uniref:Large ribosomal subunit protein uL5m n=1 Tax=Lineolata rhizophorae TaxID=578093 RepID=A0A6A6NZX4_9PEZI|nr:ribosomal protein L5 domain-containing protein [Lineolata rhizophorae]